MSLLSVDPSSLDRIAQAATQLGPGGGAQAQAASDIGKLSSEKEKVLEPVRQKAVKDMATDKADADRLYGQVKPFQAPPPPDKKQFQTDPIAQFGSFAGVFAQLASALTHAPMANALNAAAAGMNAAREGDAKAYTQSYTEWKENVQLAKDRHDEQVQAYQLAREKFKDDPQALQAAEAALAAKFDDQIMMRLKQAGLEGEAAHLEQGRINSARQAFGMISDFEEKADKVQMGLHVKDLQKQAVEEAKQHAQAAGQPFTAQDQATIEGAVAARMRGIAPGSALKTEQAGLIDQAMQEAQAAKGNVPLTAVEKLDIYNKVMKPTPAPRSGQAAAAQKFLAENPDATAADVQKFLAKGQALSGSAKAFATGKQGQQVQSFNVMTDHLETLRGLVDALKNGDNQTFNKAANEWAAEFGKPAPTNFDSAKKLVIPEVVKAVQGGPGGVSERLEMENLLDKAESPEQLRGAIDTIYKLAGGQLRGLEKTYKHSVGDDGFDDMLTSDAKKAMLGGKIGEDAPAGAPAVGAIQGGYKFKGGNPADPSSWEKQ